MEYKSGDKLCNCTILSKCGSGAFGNVYLAKDSIGTTVAIKVISNGCKYSQRELAGLKNYKDINHPNLLKIRYVDITEENIICIMDAADNLNKGQDNYIPDTLANRLRKFGRLDGQEITLMVEEILNGLEELHKNNLIHRDIKPDNILWVNGRATLGDVGLIANAGANSLVGSLGFLSPHIMEGHPAEAADDFYALGKVIYCALTGLAVSEYPSIPMDMTISINANLNRVLRISCTQRILSVNQFRELLKGENLPPPTLPKSSPKRVIPFKQVLLALAFITLLAAFIYLFIKQRQMEAKHIVQKVEINPKDEKKLKQLETLPQDAANDLQKSISILFNRLGFLSDGGKLLPILLNYQLLTSDQMKELLLYSNRTPRMVPIVGVPPRSSKSLTPIETKLLSILFSYTPNFDAKEVKLRQDFWRSKKSLPEETQKKMLSTDPVMQAIAIDAVIRSGINSILKTNKFTTNDEEELKYLLKLRYYLLTPNMYELEYMNKAFDK